MNRKFLPFLRVTLPTEDEDPNNRRFIGENRFKEPLTGILEVPYALKLITPSLIHHYSDLIMFLRHDVKKYPRLMVIENGPYPYPFIEVYNIELKLLYEIDITFKSRNQLNKLMRDYDQLPINSLERLSPPDMPEQQLLKMAKRKADLMGIGMFP
ncbi:uncharacterized protein [Halyomorpha halys]|uniref:uncharacterized protein n=1 Tax=Halyomorpha halys TaxID=286706 RepID=UPI0006D4E529|nr:uncharacterized protein LOC106683797 [Halyomorpha halys]